MELSPEARAIQRKKNNEWQKAWRKKNHEKYAQNQVNYWERLAKKAKEAEEATEKNK